MQWFYNLKISRKLMLAFVVVIALTAVLGVYAIAQLVKVNRASTVIATESLPSVRIVLQMQSSLSRFRISELQHIVSTEEADYAAAEKAMVTRTAIFNKAKESYVPHVLTEEEKTVFAALNKNLESYATENKKILALSREGKKAEANATFKGDSNKLFRQMNEQIEQLVKINSEAADQANDAAQQTYRTSQTGVAVLLGSAIILALAMAIFVARIISRPLMQAVAVSHRVAEGDLTAVIVHGSRDETGQLMQSLGQMNTSLLQIVSQVRLGTDTIASASREIANGNLNLSSRTEQQAAALEETASSMNELIDTVKKNADNARQGNLLAESASTVAVKGGRVVSQVVETMDSINESSRKIVDIIGVIDGIAFQTNILALNAAVEAARAGEQGRGFAVVASEVRSLAQRSASAAKEIKELIGDSVHKVETGATLVQEAGTTMEEVVASVKRVTDIMAEISAASDHQADGIQHVNQAITQMDGVTQQNAALVEEAAAAAATMQDQAARLLQMVSVFKLDA